jgi:glucosamine-6-phosphate deaminase
MQIIVCKDYEEMSKRAAQIVIEDINKKEELSICLPTGSTPIGMYEKLAEAYSQGKVSFKKTVALSVDEYAGLPKEHDQSYAFFLNSQVFSKLDFVRDNIHLIDGENKNYNEECKLNNERIDRFGIDLLIDGIGLNGHIAFNEPAEILEDRTHLVKISESTRLANSRFFKAINEVPEYAITLGLVDIMKAKKMIVMANGSHKSEVIRRIVEDWTITPQFPASFLKLHQNLILLLDKEAASKISGKTNYTEVTNG